MTTLPVDGDLFRTLLRHQASTVTVVTAPGTPPAGFTATSFTSVSLAPPLVSFCLGRTSSSWPAVAVADHVAVHLLSHRQQGLARTFATSGIDRFAAPTRWRTGPHGVPVLDGTLAFLVCQVVNRVGAGDHVVVLAEPLLARHADGDYPLLYHRGGYTCLTLAPAAPDLLALDGAGQQLLFGAARTANTFTDDPVADEQIQAIHHLIRNAPTAFNSQPLRVVLVRSAQARQRLLPHLGRRNRAKTAAAPLVLILAADTAFHEHLPRVYPHRPELRDVFDADLAARQAQARFNAALQIGYLIVGIRAAGLAAGPMAGFDPAGIDAEYFPDGRLRSLLVVNVGQPGPDAWAERLPRLHYDDVVHTA